MSSEPQGPSAEQSPGENLPQAGSSPLPDAARNQSSNAAGPLSAARITVAVLIAALVGWGGNAVMPQWFELPEHLRGIDDDASEELHQEYTQETLRVERSNGLVYFAILGVSVGLAPMLMVCCAGAMRMLVTGLIGIVGGGLFGPLAFYAGRAMRRYVASGAELPLLGNVAETMAADTLVLVVATAVVTLPMLVGMLGTRLPGIAQKAIAVPLAGVLAGLLVPILATFVLPVERTDVFPMTGGKISALWLGVLAVLLIVLITTTGSRRPAAAASPPPSE